MAARTAVHREDLGARRNAATAAQERQEAVQERDSLQSQLDAQWAEDRGLGQQAVEAAGQEEAQAGGFSQLLRGFQTLDDLEDQTEDELEEEGEEEPQGGYEDDELEGELEEHEEHEDDETFQPAQQRKPAARKRQRPPRRVRRAMRTLRDARVPEHILRSLDADDLVEWALEVREDQIGTEGRRLAEAPGESQLGARGTQRESEEGGEGAAPKISLDLGSHMKSLADKLGISEDDAGATLGPLLNQVAQSAAAAAVQSLRPEIGELKAETAESKEQRGQRVMRENLTRLSEFHPDLEDDALLRDELLEKAAGYWKSLGGSLYQTPEEAFDDAYRATIGPLEDPVQKKTSKRRKARRNGRATIPRGQQTARQALTFDDYEKKVFLAGQRGAGYEQLQKIRKPTRRSTRKEKKSLF